MCTTHNNILDTWDFKSSSSITNPENREIFYFFTGGKIQDSSS